jgi:hypothetical protein
MWKQIKLSDEDARALKQAIRDGRIVPSDRGARFLVDGTVEIRTVDGRWYACPPPTSKLRP